MTTLEDLRNQEIKVLDHGYVKLVGWLGDDQAIVNGARLSYGPQAKKIRTDAGLIRYLLRNNHTSPIELPIIMFEIFLPLYVWGQIVRHRSARYSSLNQHSNRYAEIIDVDHMLGTDGWRLQSTVNRQGSAGVIEDPVICQALADDERDLILHAREVYDRRIDVGVAREIARKDMPQSNYTKAVWQIDLHNLLHFLQLRMDPHAQQEVREYAHVMAEVVKVWVPVAWRAFEDYRLHAVTLSALDIQVLGALLADQDINQIVDEVGWTRPGSERTEFETKVARFVPKHVLDRLPWKAVE